MASERTHGVFHRAHHNSKTAQFKMIAHHGNDPPKSFEK